MNKANVIRAKQREAQNRQKWLEQNPFLTEDSGIYVMTREEDGFRYAYVGQAKHILTRLAQHLDGHDQHIDLSIRKHGLWSEGNPGGWFVTTTHYPETELDAQEQAYIKFYADCGYQLRNKTGGSQGKGKAAIAENKPAKGYYDGKKQGRSDVLKELNKVVKYLQITPKNDTKLANRMAEKFWEILGE